MRTDHVTLMSVFWLYFLSAFMFMGVAFISGKFLGKTGLFASELSLCMPLAGYYLMRKKSISAGFSLNRTSWQFYGSGLVLSLGFIVVSDELNQLLNLIRKMDTDLSEGIRGLMIWNSPSEMILLIFGGVVCAAFAEEMVLRGFLQGHLQKYFPADKAILAASFCFAFLHFQPWFMLQHFLFSLLMGILFWRSMSVWPVIFAHAVFNMSVLLMTNLGRGSFQWYQDNDHVSAVVLLSGFALLYTGLKWVFSISSNSVET